MWKLKCYSEKENVSNWFGGVGRKKDIELERRWNLVGFGRGMGIFKEVEEVMLSVSSGGMN